jgi:hypothetical protein
MTWTVESGDLGPHLPVVVPGRRYRGWVDASDSGAGLLADSSEPPKLDIDAFFDDPRRVGSDDVLIGEHWLRSDDPGVEYHLHWLRATGECYLLRALADANPGQWATAGSLVFNSFVRPCYSKSIRLSPPLEY